MNENCGSKPPSNGGAAVGTGTAVRAGAADGGVHRMRHLFIDGLPGQLELQRQPELPGRRLRRGVVPGRVRARSISLSFGESRDLRKTAERLRSAVGPHGVPGGARV